jgi:hypothetical protein
MEFAAAGSLVRCQFDGAAAELPSVLARRLRPGDQIKLLDAMEIIAQRSSTREPQQLMYTTVGHIGPPKSSKAGVAMLRADLPGDSRSIKALFLSANAVCRYFYLLDPEEPTSLYEILHTLETATLEQLRVAWRMRALELRTYNSEAQCLSRVERAFNVLAHSDLRRCYDELRHDDDASPLFPYSGFGSILVEGRLAGDGDAFFADRILAYKPVMRSRKISLLLRQCEFLADRAVCRDGRRKLEVSLDSSLLDGLRWDLSWNHWRHWLRSRVEVDATFVHTGKYRFRRGEWILHEWDTALPSRLRVKLPDDVALDIERARAIHAPWGAC